MIRRPFRRRRCRQEAEEAPSFVAGRDMRSVIGVDGGTNGSGDAGVNGGGAGWWHWFCRGGAVRAAAALGIGYGHVGRWVGT